MVLISTLQGSDKKNLYDISADDDFFDQWDPSIATLMEEMCEPQRGLC